MNRTLLLTSHQSGSVLVVTLPEMALDAASVGAFKEQMAPFLEQQTQIVLDMTYVRFVDSAGLGCILGSLRSLQQKQGELKVCGLSKAVRALFEMVRFHRVVEIFPDSNEAVRAFATT